MVQKSSRIGLFGGSFNPIHNGHVALGKAMLRAMNLDEVWFMVSPQNPLKESADLAPEQERLRLVDLALRDVAGLKACDYEFGLPRPSFTWNTLTHLRQDFPQHEFVLIIGGDNWERFDHWAHHEDILREFSIAIYPREGCVIDEQLLPPTVRLIPVPLVNVSSTMLRDMILRNEDITRYVPQNIAHEIVKSYKKLVNCNIIKK